MRTLLEEKDLSLVDNSPKQVVRIDGTTLTPEIFTKKVGLRTIFAKNRTQHLKRLLQKF